MFLNVQLSYAPWKFWIGFEQAKICKQLIRRLVIIWVRLTYISLLGSSYAMILLLKQIYAEKGNHV